MILIIKGRKLTIKNYFNGIARFDFKELCSKNIGAEDYIKIAEVCNFIVIENIPIFNSDNSNQQQRFITLIDILYEKNIPLNDIFSITIRFIKLLRRFKKNI